MVNRSYVTLIRNGVELDIQCEDIHLGDLVKIPRNCDVPCDLILLKSSDLNGKCNITTANLDGETNLKTLLIPKGLPSIELSECDLFWKFIDFKINKFSLLPIYRQTPYSRSY